MSYLKQSFQELFEGSGECVWELNVHGQGHSVYLVLVLGLVLPEGRVTLQQLVQHAPEREPVSRRVVRRTLRKNFKRAFVSICHLQLCDLLRSNRSI